MTAPVGNSVELNAVRELHLVLFFEPLALLFSSGFSSFFPSDLIFSSCYNFVIIELVRFVVHADTCNRNSICTGNCTYTCSSLPPSILRLY